MSENSETLFLFEFLVENIRLERLFQVSDRLALFVRLLDFPPLLISQPSCGDTEHTEGEEQGKPGEYVFNRGKSCVFKMNIQSLLTQLFNTPLYATVLEVSEGRPRLVGSSLISLARVGDRIKQGGVSDPHSLIETGLSAFCDLAGERIGTISLRYKLVCLGASLLPHIADRRGFKSRGRRVEEENKSEKPELNDERTDSKILLGEDELDDGESQNENYHEDLTAFCPPRLYFSNTEQERVGDKEVDFKLLNLCSEAFTYESFSSEEEKDESPSFHQKVAFSSNAVKQEASVVTPTVTPNILREALKQLPLLNALVAELSLLTDSVHPRSCSTPNPPRIKDSPEEGSTRNRSSSKPHRKKLVYGTTKTFNLRLKQVSPLKPKHRECSSLIQRETKPSSAPGKAKREAVKSSRRKPGLNQSRGLGEDIETAVQNLTLKQKAQLSSHDRGDLRKDSHPQRETKWVHLPRVDGEERRSRSDQSESAFQDDDFKFLEEGNGRQRSSESSVDGKEDGDYLDDFHSLESSDASLPGSPESSRSRTAKPVPVPVQSPSSPHQALRGTHIIRARTPSSALGSSVDRSRKPTPAGGRADRNSSAASFLSSPGERTESPTDWDSVRGASDKSGSSFEAQQAEEMEDEVGSLDFRHKYQHISELVAPRLPGYTM